MNRGPHRSRWLNTRKRFFGHQEGRLGLKNTGTLRRDRVFQFGRKAGHPYVRVPLRPRLPSLTTHTHTPQTKNQSPTSTTSNTPTHPHRPTHPLTHPHTHTRTHTQSSNNENEDMTNYTHTTTKNIILRTAMHTNTNFPWRQSTDEL